MSYKARRSLKRKAYKTRKRFNKLAGYGRDLLDLEIISPGESRLVTQYITFWHWDYNGGNRTKRVPSKLWITVDVFTTYDAW